MRSANFSGLSVALLVKRSTSTSNDGGCTKTANACSSNFFFNSLISLLIFILCTPSKVFSAIIQENIIGIDPNSGEPILKKELHLAVELEDRLHKRRKDLRNQLLATREARAKAGQTQLDTAQAISEIIDKVQSMELEREKLIKKKQFPYLKNLKE